METVTAVVTVSIRAARESTSGAIALIAVEATRRTVIAVEATRRTVIAVEAARRTVIAVETARRTLVTVEATGGAIVTVEAARRTLVAVPALGAVAALEAALTALVLALTLEAVLALEALGARVLATVGRVAARDARLGRPAGLLLGKIGRGIRSVAAVTRAARPRLHPAAARIGGIGLEVLGRTAAAALLVLGHGEATAF
ncbi:hypothetical protein GCM10022288_22740 [Gryllotalpicola kribbensis]|uniref:Uncharacterized protein n=1 Tax=Gryllotalpicola kribbensis TaxID=993084 RepID=A0ABP8AVR8_9MICO